MKSGDLIVGGGEAYRIVEIQKGVVRVRLIAGKSIDVVVSEVPSSFLDGKTLYRATNEIADIDAEMAVAEVSNHVDVSALGSNPRLWVEAFLNRYKVGEPVPDSTTLLGWFSRMVTAGEEKKLAEQDAERKAAALAKRKKLKANKLRAEKAKARTRRGNPRTL